MAQHRGTAAAAALPAPAALLRGVSATARRLTARARRVSSAAGAGRDLVVDVVRALMQRVGLSDFGASVLLLSAICVTTGLVMGWHELTLIGAGCAVVVALAVVYTLAHTEVDATLAIANSRLKVTTKEPQSAAVSVTITNKSTSRTLRPLRIEVPCGEHPWAPRTSSLAPGAAWEGTHPVPAVRRGVITVGPVSTVRADPLRLFRNAHEAAPADEIIVHPRTVNLDRLGTGLLRDLEGQATKDLASHDMAFHALRPYVPGDDRRHIHWRTSARVDQLMVRQFVDTRSSHFAILVSGSQTEFADEAEFELALSVGASLAARASADSQTVSVLACGHTAVMSNRQRLLDPFSRAEWTPRRRRGPTLAAISQRGVRRLSGVSVGLLIGGSVLEPRQLHQAGRYFEQRTKLIAIRVGAQTRMARGSAGDLTVLNVPTLEDLPRVVRGLT